RRSGSTAAKPASSTSSFTTASRALRSCIWKHATRRPRPSRPSSVLEVLPAAPPSEVDDRAETDDRRSAARFRQQLELDQLCPQGEIPVIENQVIRHAVAVERQGLLMQRQGIHLVRGKEGEL